MSTPAAHVVVRLGDDRLRGSAKDDVLLGGVGRDYANGRSGHDACVAETEKSGEQ